MTLARLATLAASVAFAGALGLGAVLPPRSAPPTVWTTASVGGGAPTRPHVHWPRRPARAYDMYTPAGDRAIRALVLEAAARLRAGGNRDAVLDELRARYQQVAAGHLEAYDGVVRRDLAAQLDRYLAAAGYERIDLGLLSDLAA